MKKNKIIKQDHLFALVIDGEVLNSNTFQKYWPNYGSSGSGLYGWRPPKKVYFTLGTARNGLHHVPAQIKDRVEIHRFVSAGKVEISEPKVKLPKVKTKIPIQFLT